MALPIKFSTSVVLYTEAKKHVLHVCNSTTTQAGCGSSHYENVIWNLEQFSHLKKS